MGTLWGGIVTLFVDDDLIVLFLGSNLENNTIYKCLFLNQNRLTIGTNREKLEHFLEKSEERFEETRL